MAREAGYMKTVFGGVEISMASIDCLKDFEALVRVDEREACAKVCESTAPSQINGYECADLIRNRGNT